MARTNAISITTNGTTADQLAEIYGAVVDDIQSRLVSSYFKNINFSGDPTGGSVEVDRFKMATVAENTATMPDLTAIGLQNSGKTTININQDKRIAEYVAEKDAKLFGVGNVMSRRALSHGRTAAAWLDSAFFTEAITAGTAVTGLLAATAIEDNIEALVGSIASTKNDWVDGVDRADIGVTLKPTLFGKLAKYYNSVKVDGINETLIAINMNGVLVFENSRQTADVVAMAIGAVAQPAYLTEYNDDRVPGTESHIVATFLHAGTKAIMADLIKYANLETPEE